jgi:hypothetical protein
VEPYLYFCYTSLWRGQGLFYLYRTLAWTGMPQTRPVWLTHNVIHQCVLLHAHSRCRITLRKRNRNVLVEHRSLRTVTTWVLRYNKLQRLGLCCWWTNKTLYSDITFFIRIITHCSWERLSLKPPGRCTKYIQARAQPEVSGACKQARGNYATWWRNTQPLV